MYFKLIITAVIFISLLRKHTECFFFNSPIKADIFPSGDLNLFVGDVVRLSCVPRSGSPNDVYLAVVFLLPNKSYEKIRLKTTVRNSTAFAEFEGTEKFIGVVSFACFRGENQLNYTSGYVQARLHNVTSVSSVWNYEDRTFKVLWNLGADYHDRQFNIIVVPTWKANDLNTTNGKNCSESTQTSCLLDRNNFFRQSILVFSIKVEVYHVWWKSYLKNKQYFLSQQNHEFPQFVYVVKPKEKVLTAKPSNLQMEGKTSTCVNISWTSPAYFQQFQEAPRVLVKAKEPNVLNSPQLEVVNSETAAYTLNPVVSVCGLHPNTFYLLTLQVKPTKGGYWSSPFELFVNTEEAIPEFGPPMTPTSFWTGPCKDGNRDVILYWRELKPKEAKGKLENYLVKFNAKEGKVRSYSNWMRSQIACNETIKVEVYSATSVGLTTNPATLVIPSENNAFPVPLTLDLKVEKVKEFPEAGLVELNVTWNVDSLTYPHRVRLIFYFCEGQTMTPKTCLADFQYKEIPFDQQFLAMQNISKNMDRFGFALQGNGESVTGITWIECVYDRHADSPQVSDVKAFPGEKTGSILVVWKAQECSKSTLALVQYYYVEFCTQADVSNQSPCRGKKVKGGSTSETSLEDLKVDQDYTIRVRAGTFGGLGQASDSVHTKPGAPASHSDSGVETVLIVSAILLLLILGAIASFVLRRKCKNIKRKIKSNRLAYEAFVITSQSKEEQSQQSDSGVVEGTSSDSQQSNLQCERGSGMSHGNLEAYTNCTVSNTGSAPVALTDVGADPHETSIKSLVPDYCTVEDTKLVRRAPVLASPQNLSVKQGQASGKNYSKSIILPKNLEPGLLDNTKLLGPKDSHSNVNNGTEGIELGILNNGVLIQREPDEEAAGDLDDYLSNHIPSDAMKGTTRDSGNNHIQELSTSCGGYISHATSPPYLTVANTDSGNSEVQELSKGSDDYVSHPMLPTSLKVSNTDSGSSQELSEGSDDYVSHPMLPTSLTVANTDSGNSQDSSTDSKSSSSGDNMSSTYLKVAESDTDLNKAVSISNVIDNKISVSDNDVSNLGSVTESGQQSIKDNHINLPEITESETDGQDGSTCNPENQFSHYDNTDSISVSTAENESKEDITALTSDYNPSDTEPFPSPDYVSVKEINTFPNTAARELSSVYPKPHPGISHNKCVPEISCRPDQNQLTSNTSGDGHQHPTCKKLWDNENNLDNSLKPPLSLRSISEDEGIFSPTISPDSPDFAGHMKQECSPLPIFYSDGE